MAVPLKPMAYPLPSPSSLKEAENFLFFLMAYPPPPFNK